MKMKFLRMGLLCICALLLGYGQLVERHQVWSFAKEEAKHVNGAQFVQGTTTDDYMRTNSRLYDVRTLLPSTAGIKDCKT